MAGALGRARARGAGRWAGWGRRAAPAAAAPPPAGGAPAALGPGLYVVATPIGNLEDVTLRGLRVLRGADAVLAEDTRRTRALLSAHGVDLRGPLTSYREHNARAAGGLAMERLARGEAVALVSDAGTPAVSDPGWELVAAARAGGVPVHAVPGPSALPAALSVAGLAPRPRLFLGFPPGRAGPRRRLLRDVFAASRALGGLDAVFFVGPHDLPRLLEEALEEAPDGGASESAAAEGPPGAPAGGGGGVECAVVRELSKWYEEVWRGPLPEAAREFAEGRGRSRGEITLLLACPGREGGAQAVGGGRAGAGEAEAHVRWLVEACGVKPSEAAKRVAGLVGGGKNRLYEAALQAAREGGGR